MSRILITGGCGFIGRHLVKACVNDNHVVTVLDNLSNSRKGRFHRSVKFFEGDIRDIGLVKRVTINVDTIFHLAAVTSIPRTIKEWSQSHSVNLGGTVTIFDVVSRMKSPPLVIFASSSAVYGNSRRINSETDSVLPISPYGLDKLNCERQVALFGRLRQLRTLGLRLFNVYGEGQHISSLYSGVIHNFYKNICSGKELVIYGDGKQTRDFIYIGDVIKILLDIGRFEDTDTPFINVAAGKKVSILKLAELITETTKSKKINQVYE